MAKKLHNNLTKLNKYLLLRHWQNSIFLTHAILSVVKNLWWHMHLACAPLNRLEACSTLVFQTGQDPSLRSE